MLPNRRTLLLGSASLTLGGLLSNAQAAPPPAAPDRQRLRAAAAELSALERRSGGRLGVSVFEPASGARLSHRADERFAMCSTFKFLAAAAVLAQVDAAKARLDQPVAYGQADLLSYAPETKKHVGDGRMSLGDLCAAALAWSDNTAANLMLRQIGGPAALTRYIRTLGDKLTRLDRNEPTLNTAIPGDPRDTTTPAAMVEDMAAILLGHALQPASRSQLERWMAACQTGQNRLRAGLPPSWRVADKTGSGDHGTANTIALLRRDGRPPLLAAVYYTQSPATPAARDAVHAHVARLIADTF
ncbi:MAG: class A beta-lactamase [Rhodopseudomonas sp.]|nr:class A beta-lactamase [Rhodopseudomonas sp.]